MQIDFIQYEQRTQAAMRDLDLAVDDAFSVRLSFGGMPEKIVVAGSL
jgi:hypothetical protein